LTENDDLWRSLVAVEQDKPVQTAPHLTVFAEVHLRCIDLELQRPEFARVLVRHKSTNRSKVIINISRYVCTK
jgi:hypothetical protein